jgi:hypothetical protein
MSAAVCHAFDGRRQIHWKGRDRSAAVESMPRGNGRLLLSENIVVRLIAERPGNEMRLIGRISVQFRVPAMRELPSKGTACLALLVLFAATIPLRAQAPDVPSLDAPPAVAPAVQRARAITLIGNGRPEQMLTLLAATADAEEKAAAVAGASVTGQALNGPMAAWPTILSADRAGVIRLPAPEPAFEPDPPRNIAKAEPLLAHLIQGIRDDRPLPSRWNQDEDEQRSYSAVLFEASRITAEAFRKGARNDVTFAHLAAQPSKYRGQIVHVEGRLRQLRRFDPPATAKAAGVKDLYEAWIFDPVQWGADPWCILFTELPTGMKVGDNKTPMVAFDGYFFKRYKYESRNTNKDEHWRTAPLLIGRTVVLTPAPAPAPVEAEEDWPGSLVPIFLGLVAGSIGLALGLGWWFRRGDRKVRARLNLAREQRFEVNGTMTATSEEPDAAPVIELPVRRSERN